MKAFILSLIFTSIFIYFGKAEDIVHESSTVYLPRHATNFNLSVAIASVWLSSDSYCDSETYLLPHSGPNIDFVPFVNFYDNITDMNGFIGYNNATENIFIVYRGSAPKSKPNLRSDIQIGQIDSTFENCTSCLLHRGFNACYSNTFPTVLDAVANLTSIFPTYQVIVTGHSLGGATATLASVALELAGYSPLTYTFGSPRVGNAAFASYVADLYPPERTPFRITHNRDMIPHLPFKLFGYEHIGLEIFEDVNHYLHECIGTDDTSCSAQYSFLFTNHADHVTYLRKSMFCNQQNDDDDQT